MHNMVVVVVDGCIDKFFWPGGDMVYKLFHFSHASIS